MNDEPLSKVPQFPLKLLKAFCNPIYHPDIEGDLLELYERRVETVGVKKAKWSLYKDVLLLFRPGIIRPIKLFSNLTHFSMFRHNFKISFRTLWRDKGFSLINIGGLALGMTVTLLIGLWLWSELSYNKGFDNYDHIALINQRGTLNDGTQYVGAYQVSALGEKLRTDYGQHFDKIVMVMETEEYILSNEDKTFVQKGDFMQADAPEMFSLNMLYGTREGLEEKHSILLSNTLKEKFFGTENPINKTLQINGGQALTVTGVYEDFPRNSKFWETSFIGPLGMYFTLTGQDFNIWDNQNMQVYAQIRPDGDFGEVSRVIKDVYYQNMPEEYKPSRPELFLQPMKDWHLNNEFENGQLVLSSRKKLVWFNALIGLFVLLLACINFVNLSTARSERRAKEIGVRKSIGSLRKQLVNQFLSESILVALFAFGIGLLLVNLLLPAFNQLAGQSIALPWRQPLFWALGLGFTFLTGLLAGSYPALHLSGFKPVHALKGSFNAGKSSANLRKSLVVFQFTISIALIIGTLVVFQQVQHTKNRPVGYDRGGLITLPKRTSEIYKKADILRTELKRTGAVTEIGECNYPLTNTDGNNNGFSWQGSTEADKQISFNTIRINYDYGKAVDWELLSGRDFSREMATDANGVVITEATRKAMRMENPVGSQITFSEDYFGGPEFTVLGVVKDLIKGSPYEAPVPAIMFLSKHELNWMFMRINPDMPIGEALGKIESVFKEVVPATPFDYQFMDEAYGAKFKTEQQIGKLAAFFATLAILVSCLGLFGLAAYVVERRTKEISIRKVLGASGLNIWHLLSKDFLILVSAACCIAIPLSYYLLGTWLGQYEYRTEMPWTVFGLTIMTVFFLVVSIISVQVVRVTRSNPINALKAE